MMYNIDVKLLLYCLYIIMHNLIYHKHQWHIGTATVKECTNVLANVFILIIIFPHVYTGVFYSISNFDN